MDGDGLSDLVVANNIQSRITILHNRTGSTNPPARRASLELNQLPPGARFEIESLASEKRISALLAEDLNGDGRADLAYYGEPRELIVVCKEPVGGWTPPKRWPIQDAELTAGALAADDLDGDGLTDLLLLAESHLYFLRQIANHGFAEPAKIPISSPARSMQFIDADGDGHRDLVMVNADEPNPFRLRLRQAGGQLGPEIFFASPPMRAYRAGRIETGGPAHLVSIAQNSGRAQLYQFTRKPAEPLNGAFQQGQFQVLPLAHSDRARRGMLWADLNADTLQDLIVTEPESGQISISLQETNGSLAPSKVFPCLAGVSQAAAGDWDGDATPELFLLSADERQVGVTRLDGGQRLPFPDLLPVSGKPLVMSAGRAKPGTPLCLAVITEHDSRRSLEIHRARGAALIQELSAGYRGNPKALSWHDADQDGLADLVLLTPYEKVKVLRQTDAGEFEELDVPPPGGSIEQPWLASADLEGDGKPELLLSQRNFARAVVLKRSSAGASAETNVWVFDVKEQINGAESNSRLAGAAVIEDEKGRAGAVFLLDAERKALTLCARDNGGVWRVVRNIPLPVSEFTALQVARLGGDRLPAVVMLGLNVAGLLPLQGSIWELAEVDGYETPISQGHLNDVVLGDLDNDGRKELIFLETGRNYVDVVRVTPGGKLARGNRWQVFEEHTFRARTSALPEPREAAVADVTGDGKNDLIVLVHDRLLVYPQE